MTTRSTDLFLFLFVFFLGQLNCNNYLTKINWMPLQYNYFNYIVTSKIQDNILSNLI